MKRILATAFAGVAMLSAQSLDVQLQRAVQKEVATGDLKAAIEEYQKIASNSSSSRSVAAKALLHEGQAHQKLGDAEAQKLYERVLRDYADQKEAAASAQRYLASAMLDQKEEFLRTARIVGQRSFSTGVVRVTLSDGKTAHDASVKSAGYEPNVAVWKLARLLGLDDMIPPSVVRVYEGQPAAFTWWIDEVLMDESERLRRYQVAPDPTALDREVNVMRVFDQLISNPDRPATNILLDTRWRLWMIDFERAFRPQTTLPDSKMLLSCDRNLLARMKVLDEAILQRELKPYLNQDEIRSLLARRDMIVTILERKGESALFGRPSRF